MGPESAGQCQYQTAFNKGRRNCTSINLAYAEMFLVIAVLARYDMSLFETDITDVEFKHDFNVDYPKLDSDGVSVMVKVEATVH